MNAITTFLGSMIMRFNGGYFRFLGAGLEDAVNSEYQGTEVKKGSQDEFWKNMVTKLARIADWLLPTIMILMGMVGAIYAVVLGVKYSKAEGEDQKNEAKKKLINGLIGIVVAILIMMVMMIILNNASFIKEWIMGEDSSN